MQTLASIRISVDKGLSSSLLLFTQIDCIAFTSGPLAAVTPIWSDDSPRRSQTLPDNGLKHTCEAIFLCSKLCARNSHARRVFVLSPFDTPVVVP